MKDEFEAVLFEMERGELLTGRRLEKIDGFYTVRLNDQFRVGFSLISGETSCREHEVEILAVGKHDEVYRYLNRR